MIETRPSAAPRWTRCALAPTMTERVGPTPESDAAREGTCAAWVAEMVLTGETPACVDVIGHAHENGWVVDDEMADHVQGYVDHCRSRIASGGEIWAEHHVTLMDDPLIAGTLDCATLMDGTLTVSDLKYGHVPVKPDSPQLLIYAGAMLAEVGRYVTRIRTEIYQPRAFVSGGPSQTRMWTVNEVMEQCDWIIKRAVACHDMTPTGSPGPHCRYCDGAGRGCDALAATSAQIMATIEDADHGNLDATGLARQLEFHRWAMPTLKAAADAAEAEAISRHKAGDRLPGYGLSERMGQTRVTATRDAIRALTGVDVPVKEKPPAVGDLRKAGLTDRQIGLFTTRPSIGHKLEKLDPDELQRQFSGNTGE